MPSSEPGPLYWSFLGSLPYGEADELQRRLRERVRQTPGGGYLLLLEHPHVFTLGRNANPGDILVDEEWLSSKETAVFASDRGGRVTYHGPGQLVGYPILDLSPDRRDLRRYVRDLQEVLVRALERSGYRGRAPPPDGGDRRLGRGSRRSPPSVSTSVAGSPPMALPSTSRPISRTSQASSPAGWKGWR